MAKADETPENVTEVPEIATRRLLLRSWRDADRRRYAAQRAGRAPATNRPRRG